MKRESTVLLNMKSRTNLLLLLLVYWQGSKKKVEHMSQRCAGRGYDLIKM